MSTGILAALVAATPEPDANTIPSGGEGVADHPAVIYALIVFAVLSVLAKAVPKVEEALGPIGKWLTRRSEKQRVAAMEETRDRLKVEEDHRQWDHDVATRLARHGETVDPPPPLP